MKEWKNKLADMTETIDLVYNLIKDIKSYNARIKIIKQYITEDMYKYFNAISLNHIDYCIMHKLSTVPVGWCGNRAKYKSGIFLKVCENYDVHNKDSCIICHNKRTEESTSKIKKTSLEKYGTEFPNQSTEVKEKIRSSWDSIQPEELEIIKKKRIDTSEKNGTMVLRTPEGKQNIINARRFQKDEIEFKKTKQYEIKKLHKIEQCIDKEKYELVDIKVGTYRKCQFRCLQCNSLFAAYSHWDCKYVKCPNCENNKCRSKMEDEIIEVIKSTIPSIEIITNSRNIIPPNELDIYLPEYNLAIEINGMYYHSDYFKDKNYHQNKVLKCREKGIKLLTIFDHVWNSKRDIVISMIKNSLKVNTKIYARKCTLKEIDRKISTEFINKHHIQGSVTGAKVNLGLYFNDELVSVMTFAKSRYNKKYQYEILRFCSSCSVVGAGSKLLKYFIKMYKPTSIITYADLMYGYGDSYLLMGFEFSHISTPGYYYANTKNETISRYSTQKHKLVKKLGEAYYKYSENEIMNSLKYYKIYNCGNSVYVMNIPDEVNVVENLE